MAVVLAAVVACEEGVEAGNLDQVHACSQDVTGWVWCNSYAVVSVSGVEGDRLDLWQGRENVVLVEELIDSATVVCTRSGSMCVLHADRILHEPFVDGFCRVCHVHTASEVGFGQDVW